MTDAADRDLTCGLTEAEIAQLVGMDLISDGTPRQDGSYPDGVRLWLTPRGLDVFFGMVEYAKELRRIFEAP